MESKTCALFVFLSVDLGDIFVWYEFFAKPLYGVPVDLAR